MRGRKSLLQQLDDHQPYDEHEARMLDRLRRFVGEHEDCFERTLTLGHVTGSAWVVDLDCEYVLLTHHVNLDKWLQLGGHADGEPDIVKVALREAQEESGLKEIRLLSKKIFDVDVHEIPARGGQQAHYHYDIRFLFEADRHQPLQISAESKALAWVKIAEVQKLTQEESVLRMAAKTQLVWGVRS
ncbi:MAG TPA: NUDIX hydrolase [Acidobacteriota bacterium]|nr:NUDIX hydrolase [Acidobacteriota bacterium]